MKLNCKPGDLAVITRDPKDDKRERTAGRFCTVLHAAPLSNFRLPDGYMALPGRVGDWVIELQRPVDVSVRFNGVVSVRKSLYVVVNDKYLRPIRDNPGQDEILRIVGLPEMEPA